MKRTAILLILIAVVLLGAAADLAWHYPRLPERVATRFGSAGNAIEWTSKSGFLTGNVCMYGCLALCFVGLRLALPWIPAGLINVPRQDYWLTPARLDYTRSLVGDFLLAFGAVMLSFVAGLQHLTLRANLTPDPHLGTGVWVLLGSYLAVTIVLIVGLVRRFRRP